MRQINLGRRAFRRRRPPGSPLKRLLPSAFRSITRPRLTSISFGIIPGGTMSERLLGFVYIALAIALTLYGQLVVKWQVNSMGNAPAGLDQKLSFLFRLLTNPWVISSFAAAFGAAMVWMLAIARLDLSYAYPFMSLTFPSILLLSYLLFNEPVNIGKAVGVGFIVAGIIIHSRS
jgi:multidrug transporter EmrE-like cation transporter